MNCPHDGGELQPYDEANPAKAGRSFCVACNCSFDAWGLATRGAGCKAQEPEAQSEPAETTEEPEQAAKPRSRRRAES